MSFARLEGSKVKQIEDGISEELTKYLKNKIPELLSNSEELQSTVEPHAYYRGRKKQIPYINYSVGVQTRDFKLLESAGKYLIDSFLTDSNFLFDEGIVFRQYPTVFWHDEDSKGIIRMRVAKVPYSELNYSIDPK